MLLAMLLSSQSDFERESPSCRVNNRYSAKRGVPRPDKIDEAVKIVARWCQNAHHPCEPGSKNGIRRAAVIPQDLLMLLCHRYGPTSEIAGVGSKQEIHVVSDDEAFGQLGTALQLTAIVIADEAERKLLRIVA